MGHQRASHQETGNEIAKSIEKQHFENIGISRKLAAMVPDWAMSFQGR
jgi:hypothetical protein